MCLKWFRAGYVAIDHSRCSKWHPFAFTHTRSCVCHWLRRWCPEEYGRKCRWASASARQYRVSVFIAHQHTAVLSVRPWCSGNRWKQLIVIVFFHRTVAQNHSSFISIKHLHEIPSESPLPPPCEVDKWGIKISRFSTNNSLYFADDTR